MAAAAYEPLIQWCLEHGVVISDVHASDVEIGERGIVATCPLESGRIVLEVPERLLLTVASARRDSQLGPLILQHQLPSFQTLAVHLLHEASKGQNSFWHVYIRFLPTKYTTLCTFNDQEIEALQVPEAIATSTTAISEAKAKWELARPVLRALDLPVKWRTFGAWLWATAAILSRTMFVPFDPVGSLTPFGDLFNYEPPAAPSTPNLLSNSAIPTEQNQAEDAPDMSGDGHFDEATQTYKIIARRRYDPGDQVFLCYGAHTNLDLLDTYGFLIPHNPHDRAYISPDLFSQQCTFKPIPAAACYLHADGHPSWDLLHHLRLNAASAADRKAKGHVLAAGQSISVRDDIKCLIWLVEACQQHLKHLPTSMEQDEELLLLLQQQQQAVREQMVLAVQWRISHKRIVRGAVDVAQKWFVELRKSL